MKLWSQWKANGVFFKIQFISLNVENKDLFSKLFSNSTIFHHAEKRLFKCAFKQISTMKEINIIILIGRMLVFNGENVGKGITVFSERAFLLFYDITFG